MLRRALILLCLAAPLSAVAQTTSSVILTFKDRSGNTLTSNTLGRIRCDGTDDPSLTINWTLVPTTATNPAYGDNDTYRIAATTTSTCPSDDTTGVIDIIPANKSASGVYPNTATPLLLSTVLTKVSLVCQGNNTDQTVRVCVTLKRGTGGTADGSVPFNTFILQLAPPPDPAGISVGPGDSALIISWAKGTRGTGQAETDRVRVTVTPRDPSADPGGPRVDETAASPFRRGGLVNGVLYDVTVQALSIGGNLSATAVAGTGTPALVNDFFEQYREQGGKEEGGCAGGAAGLLSLLGLGAVVRAFRRRS
jgi:hypothetical protein